MRAPIPENLNTVREAVEREGEELFGEGWTGEEWREHASAIKELQADPPEIPNFVEAAKAPGRRDACVRLQSRRDACVRLQCAYNSLCKKLQNGHLSAVTIDEDGLTRPVERAFFLSRFVWLGLSEGSITGVGELYLVRPSPLPEQTVGKNRGGRKALPWDSFWVELVLIANDDGLAETPRGLPDAQSELVERMQVWCRDHWGEEPGESTVRQRITALYKRQAERQAERQKLP
jgi:hypothetical protein